MAPHAHVRQQVGERRTAGPATLLHTHTPTPTGTWWRPCWAKVSPVHSLLEQLYDGDGCVSVQASGGLIQELLFRSPPDTPLKNSVPICMVKDTPLFEQTPLLSFW